MRKKMKVLSSIVVFLISFTVSATENIKVYSPYSPGHSATPAMLKIIDEANSSQNIYKFLLEFKPGGNQIIAVKSLDPQNSLAIIAPAFVENLASGQLSEQDYSPVYALGDACWAVITNKPLRAQKEFVVGGVGYGNAAHLTALALGEKHKFSVRYIVFKSNNDALINMVGDNGIEFVIDRFEGYNNLKSKNSKLTMIAASCPTRLPQAPNVPTLKEMGVAAPYIFNIIIAHKDMPRGRKVAIAKILEAATDRIGDDEIYKLSAVRPPQFDRVSAEQFYNKSISTVKTLQNKYKAQIEQSK
jgi:tripartite-type tricarboxylate transporter receptor subunit TctC